jgi:hypothetical protein
MRISSHTTKYIELTIPYEEAVKINQCDPETVNEFGELIRKYCQEIADAKRIRTRQMLAFNSQEAQAYAEARQEVLEEEF